MNTHDETTENTATADMKENETALDSENVETETQAQIPAEQDLTEQLAQMKDQWLRSLAECENLRRRNVKDREEALKYGAVSFARDIVGTVDNLERALDAAKKIDNADDHLKNLVMGIEMTLKEIDSVFSKQNIKRVDALHVKFDPNNHQAMFEIETDEHEPGTVVNVIQHGFMIHDRLLRPAMVGVSKAKAE
jgi:molecular chaperone GrpE